MGISTVVMAVESMIWESRIPILLYFHRIRRSLTSNTTNTVWEGLTTGIAGLSLPLPGIGFPMVQQAVNSLTTQNPNADILTNPIHLCLLVCTHIKILSLSYYMSLGIVHVFSLFLKDIKKENGKHVVHPACRKRLSIRQAGWII